MWKIEQFFSCCYHFFHYPSFSGVSTNNLFRNSFYWNLPFRYHHIEETSKNTISINFLWCCNSLLTKRNGSLLSCRSQSKPLKLRLTRHLKNCPFCFLQQNPDSTKVPKSANQVDSFMHLNSCFPKTTGLICSINVLSINSKKMKRKSIENPSFCSLHQSPNSPKIPRKAFKSYLDNKSSFSAKHEAGNLASDEKLQNQLQLPNKPQNVLKLPTSKILDPQKQ